MDNDNNKFSFTYSAPTEAERKEIESIKRQYKPESLEESKIDRLRKLHSQVVGSATAASLAVGVVGILVFGFGLACVLEFDRTALGIILASIGALPVALAYPIYKHMLERGRAKHGDEIIRLSEELLGE